MNLTEEISSLKKSLSSLVTIEEKLTIQEKDINNLKIITKQNKFNIGVLKNLRSELTLSEFLLSGIYAILITKQPYSWIIFYIFIHIAWYLSIIKLFKKFDKIYSNITDFNLADQIQLS